MRKVVFLLVFMVGALQASAQKGKPVQLTSSESFKGFTKAGVMRIIRPIFSQEGSTLAADSADFNQNANTFDAFGNVVITQPNGTIVYADELNYNGTTRMALLTKNVRLVDKEATLTTNFLTYNLGTRIGTYTGGGKVENGADVLTSKTGYYFASTRDAYFRYDVLVNTPDAVITTDTLKYNSGTRISNFYGPTNIKGKTDQSNLYTENGRYNTLTDQAWFGKRNLYTEGSKSLRGDSLYYDGKAGFGKAINNITFIDTTQKITLKGNEGIYHRADESALVTRNAYVVLQTEPDSGAVDSIYMAADTLRTKLIFLRDLKPANQEELKSDEDIQDEPTEDTAMGSETLAAEGQREAEVPEASRKESEAVKDTIGKKEELPARKRKAKRIAQSEERDKRKKSALIEKKEQATNALKDSSVVAADTLLKAPGDLKAVNDTTKKDSILKKVNVKAPLDTTRTRIVLAYNKVKIFKSDLQTRADSAFYSYADSIIRCYVNPMIWTQGTQLSADTIFLQLKNQKLDNMLLQNNGFIVSTELDSVKFNQVKGKVLTGVFRDNKLSQMFVDGNAESIYYTVQDSVYSGLNRSISSRMRLEFKDSKLTDVVLVRKPEGKYYPIEKVDKDIEILKGFIWKPNDRPKSKEEIIPTLVKTSPPAKNAAPVKKATGKKPANKR